jgi:L-malate glycosyltransferase
MQTLYLVKALVRFGHKVRVLCYFEHEPAVVDEYRLEGADVLLMGIDRGIRQASFVGILRKELAGCAPDAVHVQYMTPGALAIVAARLAGIRTVYATVHQPYSSWHSPLWKLLLRCSSLLCTHFMVVSRIAEESWFGSSRLMTGTEAGSLPRHFTLHNAVDTAAVRDLVRSEAALALKHSYCRVNRVIFGYVGRLSHEKGADVLFDAFALLAGRHAGAFLLVVGDGPERTALESHCRNEGLHERVFFAGKLSWSEAMQHLAVMDAIVVPSRFEGFGLSAVEAMAAAKPVIASRAGGLSEIITHGHDGLLFENGNHRELSAMMEMLLLHPVKRAGFSRQAFQRASDFDVAHFNRKIRKLYKPEA